MARTSSPSFWSPAMDVDIDHWIQIDFLRMTRVRKIVLQSVLDTARITEVAIQSAFDGNNWVDVVTASAETAGRMSGRINGRKAAGGGESNSNILKIKYSEDGISLLKTDLKTRHLRITAKNYEFVQQKSMKKNKQQSGSTPSSSSTKTPEKKANPDLFDVGRELIGLKLELFGCYLEADRSTDESSPMFSSGKCSFDVSSQANGSSSSSSPFPVSWFLNSASSPAKHLSVNSHLNLIFVCEVSKDVR